MHLVEFWFSICLFTLGKLIVVLYCGFVCVVDLFVYFVESLCFPVWALDLLVFGVLFDCGLF